MKVYIIVLHTVPSYRTEITTGLQLVLQLRFKLNASVARVQQNGQTSLGESGGWTSPFFSLDERKAHPEHSFIINGYTRDTKFIIQHCLFPPITLGGSATIRDFLQPTYLDRKSELDICVPSNFHLFNSRLL